MNRIQPIRTTRNSWPISLYCYHQCSDQKCSSSIQQTTNENGDTIILFEQNAQYKDGKCERNNIVYPTFIQLATYDYARPYGDEGPLYEPDQIVIPDNDFDIIVDFPLEHVTSIHVQSEGNCTLRKLLFLLRTTYEDIYRKEEDTATEETFILSKDCSCKEINLERLITEQSEEGDIDSECSICYSALTGALSKLRCSHVFHTECLMHWITKGDGDKCPLCRTTLYECKENCSDGSISYSYTTRVIPPELRDSPFRNRTNGIYCIYNYDYEQLIVEQIFYNRIQRKLYLEMSIY